MIKHNTTGYLYKDFYKSGEIHGYFDYTKHYKEQHHTWYLYQYDKNGNVTYEGYSIEGRGMGLDNNIKK